MLTEINQTLYAIRVNGQTVFSNIQSRQLAEAQVFSLPQEQRAIAEIVPITTDGKTVLFG